MLDFTEVLGENITVDNYANVIINEITNENEKSVKKPRVIKPVMAI